MRMKQQPVTFRSQRIMKTKWSRAVAHQQLMHDVKMNPGMSISVGENQSKNTTEGNIQRKGTPSSRTNDSASPVSDAQAKATLRLCAFLSTMQKMTQLWRIAGRAPAKGTAPKTVQTTFRPGFASNAVVQGTAAGSVQIMAGPERDTPDRAAATGGM
mmetsp:Transcript_1067/g.2862  ORF Transcript_1067/g.2862 Transcript_1067/m.2862 type:complete len:157 (-) Transcript_1067:2937-3407(-)